MDDRVDFASIRLKRSRCIIFFPGPRCSPSAWREITTLVIPGENDSEDEIERLTQWVMEHLGHDVPIHFSGFHPDYRMLDRPATPPATLALARKIAMKNGIRYAYTGNVQDREGGSTSCHHCGETLIGRDRYELSDWNVTENGACRFCHRPCAGVFKSRPGHWGARRVPLLLKQLR